MVKIVRSRALRKICSTLVVAVIVLSLFVMSMPVLAAAEDFTTWTEVDVDGRVTVTSSSINMTTIDTLGNHGCWVYRDMGTAHYGDTFSGNMTFEFAIHNTPANNDPQVFVWGLSNSTNPVKYTQEFASFGVTEVSRAYLYVWDDSTEYKDFTSSGFISIDTTYYCTAYRGSGAFTVWIYSDSGRTTLLDTLTCNDGSASYRYVFGFASSQTSANRLITTTVSNLDINEPENPPPTVTTDGEYNVTSSSVNLTGTVVSSSTNVTSWGIQLGTETGTYTSNWTGTGNVAAPVDIDHEFTGLDEGEHYFYRAFAVNTGGIAYGSEDDFYAVDEGTLIVGDMTIDTNMETAGVIIDFTADEDSDASVLLEYRTGGGEWSTAPVMWRDDDEGQYKGKIFWLTEATTYEIRATFTDSDGVLGTNPLSENITTVDSTPAFGSVHTYHVAKTGNDSTGDGSSGSPWLTIQKAANMVSAGDTVYVHVGTYAEMVTVTADGNISNYITFSNYNSEEVIVDGGSSRTDGFYLNDANYVHITGFTIQDTTKNSFRLNGCSYSIVDNCIMNDPTVGSTTGVEGGVRLEGGSDHCMFIDNEVNVSASCDVDMAAFTWWYAGDSNVFKANTINGTGVAKDGFGGGPENSDGYMDNSDIYENTIDGVWDDGIQLEGSDVNTAVWGNTITDCFIGIGFCPANIGPHYVFRNVIVNNPSTGSAAYKLGDGSYARVFMYHNTSFTTGGQDGVKQTNPELDGVVSRNNIYYTGRYIFEFLTSGTSDMDCDYDYMYTTDGSRFVKFDNGTYATYALFVAAYPAQEANAIVSADPGFTDNSTNDFTLVSDSVCLNVGEVLVGFNDENSPWPYSGVAPDLGAYEYDEGAPVYTAPEIDLDAASLVTMTTARLNADVIDAGGTSGNVTFVWGDDDAGTTLGSWDYSSAPDSPAQPQGEGTCYVDIDSLSASTVYYYSVTITTVNGTDWPVASGNFTTLASYTAPEIALGAASLIEATTARLNANVLDDGGTTGNVTFYYGLTDEGTTPGSWDSSAAPTSPAQPQGSGTCYLDVTSLLTGRTYYFSASITTVNGTDWPVASLSFLTAPAAPTVLSATDGTSTSNVTLTWVDPVGVDEIYIVRDGSTIDSVLAGVQTYEDTGADMAVITPGTAVATDGTSTADVDLSLSGTSVANGTTHTYIVIALNTTGYSENSTPDTGYRGHGALSYAWEVSAADSDASYSAIPGGTTAAYTYNGTPAPTITTGTVTASDGASALHVTLSLAGESANSGAGRYFKCVLEADGCEPDESTANRGYRGVGSLTYQWQRSAADADAAYSDIAGATTDPYNDTGAPVDGSGRYYKAVLNATGASQVVTLANRGYINASPAPAAEDPGTMIIKYTLTAVIAVIAIIVVISARSPVVWMFAITTAVIAIVFINSAL